MNARYSKLTMAFLLLGLVGCAKDVTTYHTKDQKESEGNLKNNQKDGLWTEWYPNGKKSSETHYKNGRKDGLSTHWHENGQKSWEDHYKNGK